MTDKEMIEEMARVIFERGVALDGTDFVFGLNGSDHFERIATAIYNAGYRKIPEGSVVLSKEENEELQKGVKTHNYTAMFNASQEARILELEKRLCNIAYEARKETAREILQKLFKEHNVFNDNDVIIAWQVKEILKEVAKQVGVEVEE